MQVHQIQKPKQKNKRRVGRGGKRGTYSGRGMKGQKSRAGHRIRPQIWDYIFKIPKLKGPTNKAQGKGFNTRGGGVMGSKNTSPVFTVNTGEIEKIVKKDDIIDIDFLIRNNLTKKHKGRFPKRVKLLAKGNLTKAITVKGLMLSASAKKQVEDAGGKIK